MESYPRKETGIAFGTLSYDAQALRLHEMAGVVLEEHNLLTDTFYAKFEYTPESPELSGIAPIFDTYLIDSPNKLQLIFADNRLRANDPSDAARILMIATEAAEFHTEYCMLYGPLKSDAVDFTKDISRVYESPEPYASGRFECAAIIREVVTMRAPLENSEMLLLHDVLLHLAPSHGVDSENAL